jgi:hypothetical protein
MTAPGNGPEGVPAELARPLATPLAYGTTSSDIHTVNLVQGAQLAMTIDTPDWEDTPGLLFVWEPATSGGVADPQLQPSDASGWYDSGTAVFTAPRAGRYAFGFQLTEAGADGTYQLRATCATCTDPLGALTVGATPFSPNNDGVKDTLAGSFTATAAGTVTVAVRTTAGALVRTLATASVTGAASVPWSWNGNDAAGRPMAQGTYRVHAGVRRSDGNDWVRTADVTVDRTRPSPSWMGTSLRTFNPYPDHYRDTIDLRFRPAEACASGRVDVYDAAGRKVWASAAFGATSPAAIKAVRFAGRSSSGRLLASGRYAFTVTLSDRAGLAGASRKQGFWLDARRR